LTLPCNVHAIEKNGHYAKPRNLIFGDSGVAIMGLKKFPLLAAVALAIVPMTGTVAETGVPTVPIDIWALRDTVATMDISPDGKHMLMLRMPSKDGEYIMEIFKTDDLSKPWRTLNAKPMEMITAQFVHDDYIFGAAWQVVRDKVEGAEGDVRSYKSWAYNLKTNKFSELPGQFNLVNVLPKDPDKILIATSTPNDGGMGVDPFAAFRPRSYYKFDLRDGTRELVMRGTLQNPTAEFDIDGNPRYSQGYNEATNELVTYYRNPGDNSWKEFGQRYDLDKHENLYRLLGGFQGLVGFKADDPNIGYMIDNRGEDKAALWEFDFRTGQFGRKLFSVPTADVLDIKTNSMYWAGDTTLAAAIYPGAKMERHWFDPQEKQLYELLEKSIPNAHNVNIKTRSQDGKTMLVTNSGPHDPGSFWLFVDGKIGKLASKNPLLKPEQLSDVEFINYPARDGQNVPAYLTKPKGKGPFPLIVLPHGGPHVTEVINYDEWGQLLANAGYMVLQPQYRMSVGWGQKHFDSAYGQHGLAMQDDKDDGVKYLVSKGLVDPNRVAMFGWSYGGYAALVASQRTPQLYQCAIAGAAVADPEKSYIKGRDPNGAKALDDWAKRRGTIGINPIKDIAKTNIPTLMVHGTVDRRVEYWHAKDYQTAAQKAGITGRVIVGDDDAGDGGVRTPGAAGTSGTERVSGGTSGGYVKFVDLEGADHFYTTLMYDHQHKLYTNMLDFLKNDCGPGGL
jgi:dipeptidyl aminopeptidase/acylaminoacyl peptidase